jgi:hypothetical protein
MRVVLSALQQAPRATGGKRGATSANDAEGSRGPGDASWSAGTGGAFYKFDPHGPYQRCFRCRTGSAATDSTLCRRCHAHSSSLGFTGDKFDWDKAERAARAVEQFVTGEQVR